MKYSEIIGLKEYFQPFYSITDEIGDYWKQFIPNEQLYTVLRQVLISLEPSGTVDKRKSIWLQGAYGTGKSHATAVVKHLLWDDPKGIEDFVDGFNNIQIKERVRNFRKEHKVFPVVLKGASNITDSRTFALVVEKAVEKALKQNNIAISTQSDFEKMIYQIKENPAHIDWNKVIRANSELRMYINKSKDLVNRLENQNITILRKFEEISSNLGVHFSFTNISEWLSEVVEELKKRNIAEYLMLYWDEFTTVLELEKASILLNELQNIAELSTTKNLFLFVVSHRKPYQATLPTEDIEKILGRFHYLDYSMEPITTYHIIQAAIKKKDKVRWEEIKEKCLDNNSDMKILINRIIGDEGTTVKNAIKNLFPIHPYTAYLATFIARNIGSTERSIFTFLHNREKGFLKFIEEYPTEKEDFYLTVDYLWDFFVEEFERDNYEKFSSILDKYKLYIHNLEGKGNSYAAIFKGILLLNILYRVVKISETGSGLVSPSIDNIHSMFLGTNYEDCIDEVLTFIDSNEIIQKTPDSLFLVATSTLPIKEVEREKESQKKEYEDIGKVFTLEQRSELESIFISSTLRKTEFKIFGAGTKEHILKSKLHNTFREDYSLHIAMFVGKTSQEILEIENILYAISKEDEFKNIFFVVIEEVLTKDAFTKFIEYRARAVISERHSFNEEKVTNDTYAEKVIDAWVNRARTGYTQWYLKGEEGQELVARFTDLINTNISNKVFRFGLEALGETRKNRNIWTFKKAKSSVEIFLFADSRKYIEDKTSKGIDRYLREIIKDNIGEYVVNESLEIKSDAGENHPVVEMFSEIRKRVKNNKNEGVFHIGEALKFLPKPPYGLYTNMVNMATMGFLMRQFIGRLYEAGTGRPLERETMRDKILSLFKYWQEGKDSNKLEVRFGTEEEKKLIDILKYIFILQDQEVNSLNDVRWKIREWIKDAKYPLWAFKVSCSNDKIREGIDQVVWLIKSIDREITQKEINKILYSIEDIQYDLKLLIKKEKPKELFIKWLENIENVGISGEEVDDAIDFLNRNTQEEVASWDEDKVREMVKDWKLKRHDMERKLVEKGRVTTKGVDSYFVPPNKIDNVKEKIRNYSGDIKELIIRLIDEYPWLCEWLEKYL